MNELPNNNAHLLRDLVKERTAQYLKQQSDKEFEKKLKKK
tara:strand:+ start:850 stop:969 length:120 start_codon:yes stop_codon:yes gene_type:complete